MRWLAILLRSMGFSVCAHSWSSWKNDYKTGLRLTAYGFFKHTYREEPSYEETHQRQSRTCHECNALQVRHISLKTTNIHL